MLLELIIVICCSIFVLAGSLHIVKLLHCLLHCICELRGGHNMGNNVGKQDRSEINRSQTRPCRGTCASHMFDKFDPDSVSDVEKWCEWTMDSKHGFPENGTFDRDCLENLR